MTLYQKSNDPGNNSRAKLLFVVFAAISAVVGVAYSMGVFTVQETETPDPLRITLSSDRLDFGAVALNRTAMRQLVVRNDGDQPVTASFVADGSNYRVSPDQLILHPGVGSRVRVELVGSEAGKIEEQLRIVVDDKQLQPLVVTLAGHVQDSRRAPEASNSTSSETANAAERRGTRRAQPSATRRPVYTRPGQADAGTREADSGTITVASAAVGTQAAAPNVTTTTVQTGGTAPTASSRSPEGITDAQQSRADARAASRNTRRSGSPLVTGYDTMAAGPMGGMSDAVVAPSDSISREQASRANPIPSKIPGMDGEDLPDSLPETSETERTKPDIFEDDDDRDDPFPGPALTISGQSTVRFLGATATFYPQQIDVMGTGGGGPMSLSRTLDFPVVPLAFGESMLFTQTLGGASGGFDPHTGEVTLQMPIQAVDSDGDAAPLALTLTTGTALERNVNGAVVAITGSPRVPGTGILRLVGIAKIPVGFDNGGEMHLAVFEILASLTFGNSIAASGSAGGIGG